MSHTKQVNTDLSRAQFIRTTLALSLAMAWRNGDATPPSNTSGNTMLQRKIPSTGELLPAVGCGTWVGFDHAPGTPEYARLSGVLAALFDAGGTVLDSSPMYGRSEQTTGELLETVSKQTPPFLATKVWTRGREAGIRQMEQSLTYLRAQQIDLMQVHNLVDWETQLKSLRDWKAQGRIRYIGITHYSPAAHDEVEAVLRREALDFLQINYALDDQGAAKRLLPLAADKGVAVLINQPFGGGGLLRGLRDRPLPPWAGEIGCSSWAQLLLKFVLSHPSVTCVIPGTSRPEHMAENLRAGVGVMPDRRFWEQHPIKL